MQDKVLHQNSTDPVEIASNMLEGYVQGQPVGSEAEGFQEMIASVTTVDAEKGGELTTFIDSIARPGGVDRKDASRLFPLCRSGLSHKRLPDTPTLWLIDNYSKFLRYYLKFSFGWVKPMPSTGDVA